MAEATEENSDIFFTKFAQNQIQANGDHHAEWVLFHHGSLYFRTMPNNIETSKDELIQLAKESLAQVEIVPGCSAGDATIYSCDFESNTIYYSSIETFQGIIIVHPSKQITNDITAMIHARSNVLNDQQNPIVIATGNTKNKN